MTATSLTIIGLLFWILADVAPIAHAALFPEDTLRGKPSENREHLQRGHDKLTSIGSAFLCVGVVIAAGQFIGAVVAFYAWLAS
jgi:hypothetical protein